MGLLKFFRRSPDLEAETLAEALLLYEEGVEIAAILERYPAEVQFWLKPLLSTGQNIEGAFKAEEASYYFEGALKAKVLASASPVIGGDTEDLLPSPPRFGQLGAAVASVAVLVVAGMLGVITFGFVTAGDSVPGEWNYGFKRATEQAQVRFASGDERINVHIRQAQERIDEIQTLVSRGDLSTGHIDSFTDELADIRELAEEESFDRLQQAKVRSLSETADVVLSDVGETEEELAPVAAEAIDQAYQVAAAVSGGSVTPLEENVDTASSSTPESTGVAEDAVESTPESSPVESAGDTSADEVVTPTPESPGDATVSTGDEDAPKPLVSPSPEATVSTGGERDPEPLSDSDSTENSVEGNAEGSSQPADAP